MSSWLSIVANVNEISPLSTVPNELLSHIFVLLCTCGDPIYYLPYFRDEVPHQVTISQVCSRWRQIALNTGDLWSNVGISHRVASDHSRCLSIYRIWVGRAGSLPLTVALTHYNLDLILDFVVPFRLRTLDISLWYSDLSALSDLPNLDVEEFAISLIDCYDGSSDLELPQLVMDRTRYISFQGLCGTMPKSEATLNAFCSLWRQLRSLECDFIQVSLTAWLNVLQQAQSLEHCDLTIINAGNGPLVKASMPNLRSFILNLLELEVHPDIVIPLIAAPNLTTLCIFCPHIEWSSDTYNIIKQHHKFHQLHGIHFFAPGPTLHITQILEDAPMVSSLLVEGRSILDDEGLEGIASGRLGRHLTLLLLEDYVGQAGKWLDMIESRQRNVKSMVAQASNWQQLFTGIREVELRYVEAVELFEGRTATLKALGTNARISGYYSEKCSDNESAI